MIKRITAISLMFTFCNLSAFAINVGSYKTESEYGLIDGFKFNWKRSDKTQPFIEKREESTQAEREKERQEIKKNEYQYTKYLYEGKSMI